MLSWMKCLEDNCIDYIIQNILFLLGTILYQRQNTDQSPSISWFMFCPWPINAHVIILILFLSGASSTNSRNFFIASAFLIWPKRLSFISNPWVVFKRVDLNPAMLEILAMANCLINQHHFERFQSASVYSFLRLFS